MIEKLIVKANKPPGQEAIIGGRAKRIFILMLVKSRSGTYEDKPLPQEGFPFAGCLFPSDI